MSPKTNFDVEMQKMTVEDLASLKAATCATTINLCADCPIVQFCEDRYNRLLDSVDEDCYDVWLAWLKQEVSNNANE